MRVFASWSGGKDSALATHRALAQGHQVVCLLSFVSEDGRRSRSHRVPVSALQAQAEAMGLPLLCFRTSWEKYEENFKRAVDELKREGVAGGVFGDLELEEHRQWVGRVCGEVGIEPFLPLWRAESAALVEEFLELGFKALVVATRLDPSLLGRSLDWAFLAEVEKLGSHPMGENGEYHTFVTDGPLFRRPLVVLPGERREGQGVWFLDLSVRLGER